MDRGAPGFARSLEDLFDVEVRRGSEAAERNGLVRGPHVQALRVVLREDGDRRHVERRRGRRDADGNFAAVGNEEFGAVRGPNHRGIVPQTMPK